MEYMALGFKELGASVTAINSISSCTKDNCDEISISEKGIEYTTFSSHKTFWRYYTTMDISHTKNIREYIKLMQLEQS